MLQTIRRLLIRPGCFRLERELPGGVCTHDICAPWQGTQWNKVEHRLFAFITQNWRGKPLVSHEVVVNLIGATTTTTGLKVRSELDTNQYPAGRKVSDDELAVIHLRGDAFHGDWNYSLLPRPELL